MYYIHIEHQQGINVITNNNFTSFVETTCPLRLQAVGEIYANKSCTAEKVYYNERCDVSCALGYNLTSSDGVHTCSEKGTWSNNVTCERMSKQRISITLHKTHTK